MENKQLNKEVEKILKKEEMEDNKIIREIKEQERIEKAISIVLSEKTNFDVWFFSISGVWLILGLVLIIGFNNIGKLNMINSFGVMICLTFGMLVSLGFIRVYFRNKCKRILSGEKDNGNK